MLAINVGGESGSLKEPVYGVCGLRAAFTILIAILTQVFLSSSARPQSPDSSGFSADEADPDQIARAIARYQDVLAHPPPGATRADEIAVRVRLGTAYFLLQRYSDSLTALNSLATIAMKTAATPTHVPADAPGFKLRQMLAQALLVSGLDYLQLNNAATAIAPLRHSLLLDPQNANARLALGDAFARHDQMEEAETQYEEQLRLTPDLPDAWYKAGMAHIQLATQTRRAFALHSSSSTVVQQLSAEYMLTGEQNWDAARALLQLARSQPRQPGIHADLGQALFALGYTKSAEAEFRRELSLNPEIPSARLGLAECAAMQNKWDEADKQIYALAQSQPKQFALLVESSPPGPLRQTWNDGQLKRPTAGAVQPIDTFWTTWLAASSLAPEAISAIAPTAEPCREIPAIDRTTPGLWLSESCYHRLLAELQHAPQSPTTQTKVIETEFRLGQYRSALERAQQLLKVHRGDAWGIYWLSKAHSELAGDCFVKLGELAPSSPRVHQILAERYLGWGQFSQAESEYRTAIELAPTLPDLHLGLGDTYTRMLDWARAVPEYKKTLELAPGSFAAQSELGHAYYKLGEWKLAIDQLSQIPASAAQAAAARLDLANSEDQAGDTRKAITDLLPFADQDKDGEIYFRMAVFYRKIGELDHAKEAMQTFQRLRAAKLAVSHSEIQELEDENAADSHSPFQNAN